MYIENEAKLISEILLISVFYSGTECALFTSNNKTFRVKHPTLARSEYSSLKFASKLLSL